MLNAVYFSTKIVQCYKKIKICKNTLDFSCKAGKIECVSTRSVRVLIPHEGTEWEQIYEGGIDYDNQTLV